MDSLLHVQSSIGYVFRTPGHLQTALTAAGVEEPHHDGNRALAQLGNAFLQLCLVDEGHEGSASRAEINAVLEIRDSKAKRAELAQVLQLDRSLRRCPRQHHKRPSTKELSLAFSAMIGAVWKDCDHNWLKMKELITRVGASWTNQSTVNPGNILQQGSASTKILIDEIFDTRIQNPSEDAHISTFNVDPAFDIGSLQDIPFPHTWQCIDEGGSPDIGPMLASGRDMDSINITELGTIYHNDIRVNARPLTPIETCPRRKRAKMSNERTQNMLAIKTVSRRHIIAEKEKCDQWHWSFSEEDFAGYLKQMPINDQITLLHTELFYYSFAASETFLALKRMVSVYHNSAATDEMLKRSKLSFKERFELINDLEDNIALYSLLKRCHILELFREHIVPSWGSMDRFVIHTPDTAAQKKTIRTGNPANISLAEQTKSILQHVYPGLAEGALEYRRIYNQMSNLRRTGQVLDLLATKFGYGAIALLPVMEEQNGRTSTPCDSMLLSAGAARLAHMINFLDKSQGDLLRDCAQSVENLVIQLFQSTLSGESCSLLGSIDDATILSYPKGFPALLELFSRSAPALPLAQR